MVERARSLTASPSRGTSGSVARLAPFTVLCLSLASHGCELPSRDVDGRDVMGVFERDGGVDGGVVARSPEAPATSTASADAAVRAPPVSRAPAAGMCVEASGQPNRDIRRTVGRPACRRGRILEHRDAEGAPRYACLFGPSGAEATAPLPLLIFFHPGHADPTIVRKATGLPQKSLDFELATAKTGKGERERAPRAGYWILAPQGRALFGEKRGVVFDTEYVSEDNVDIQTVDQFIDAIVAEGIVDRSRIYAMGWGAGGEMATLYASVRADRIAALAAFATAPPRATWSCPTPPTPAAIFYRACDAVTSCEAVETWLRARDDHRAETLAMRLGAADAAEGHCAVNKCGPKLGTANHQRWPKGVERRVLEFLAGHTLSLSDSGPGR
jgi:poly(3-hydroxybutyrate) depolymerase